MKTPSTALWRASSPVLALLVAACAGVVQQPSAQPAVAQGKPLPSGPVAAAKMAQGVQAARAGQRQQGMTLLREAIALDPSLWEAAYDLGLLLANDGDLGGAEQELSSAGKRAPASEDVAMALAEVRRRRGESRRAARGLADFVRDHPGALDARTLAVTALREDGQVDEAIADAREVLLRKPGDATALAELALSYLAKGENQTASLLAKQALDANPNGAVAHRATGLIDLSNGDDAEAFSEFRKAAQADPHDTTSRINMGVVLLRAGGYAKAEQQYREILKVLPDDSDAHLGLAAALRGQADARHPQKLHEARLLLEGALVKSPHDASALFNLGVLLEDFLKEPGSAAPLFKRFLAEVPEGHPLRAEAERYLSAAAAHSEKTGAAP